MQKISLTINRMKQAAELLARGAYNAFEISIMVGYNSQSHFGRSFHKYYGLTPLEYQKKEAGRKLNQIGRENWNYLI